MRVPGTGDAHLTYCLNVHPGGTLAEAEAAVFQHAKSVFEKVAARTGAGGPFGVGLWLSAAAAEELAAAGRAEAFARRLAAEGFYAFTLNGFPYGKFHGTRVKRDVYRPDWSEAARLDSPASLARILACLVPEGVDGTISTLPVTYKAWADEARVSGAVENLVEAAAVLATLERSTGRAISLALEPEPDCFLERGDDVVGFFGGRLLPHGRQPLARRLGCSADEAERLLRRHIGVCLDIVHAAVRFEDPCAVVGQLTAAGIRIGKIHLGAAIDVAAGPDGPPRALEAFQDEVYLHQVTVRTAEGDVTFADLPDALAATPPVAGHWRVHFHVPLCWPGDGALGSTSGLIGAPFLRAALDAGVRHFELETYTLGVFPGEMPAVEDVMAQDLAWLLGRFKRA